MFIVPRAQARLSRDRGARSDAITEIQPGALVRQLLLDGFEIIVVLPAERYGGGVGCVDRAHGEILTGGMGGSLSGLNSSRGGGGSMQTVQRPYQPEFASSDRQNYPVHRILANRYWRLFIKLDPVIGTGLDMYAEMPWSDCKLSGEGVEGEVREVYEAMWEKCSVLSVLPAIVREFLGLGECIPHCFFDDSEGIWTYIALHDPDTLEVIDAPFIRMEPVIEFVPDDRLRAILTSSDPELAKLRNTMPAELLARLQSRQNIRINTEANATFLARKLHPYETRGTSILSRMWRVLMYEDAIFEASLATARRHAGPLKIAKLGNPQTNWIPGPEHERRFMELIAQAEVDPHAWIVYHYGLSLEAFGTTDRVLTINKEWEIIERIKLAALGISRSFLSGELTFASATAGLQVFLRRALAMRNYIESSWLTPKFFKPVAEMNGFYKSTPAERSHGIRVKRTAQEIVDEKRLIVPKIEWANKLSPQIDNDLMRAYESLEKGLGIRISKTKKMALVNLGYEDELKRSLEEDKFEDALRKKMGVPDQKPDEKEVQKIIDKTDETKKGDPEQKPDEGEAGQQPDNTHGGKHPPNPMQQNQTYQEESILKPVKPGPAKSADPVDNPGPTEPSLGKEDKDGFWKDNKYHNWDKDDVSGLVDLLQTGETESAFWSGLVPKKVKKQRQLPDGSIHILNVLEGYAPFKAMENGDEDEAWEQVENFLDDEGFPNKDIADLRKILIHEKVLNPPGEKFLEALPDDPSQLSDKQFGELFAEKVEKVPFDDRVQPKEQVKQARTLSAEDAFLIGEGNSSRYVRQRVGSRELAFSKGGDTRRISTEKQFKAVTHGVDCSCHSKTAMETPKFNGPKNYESREQWQKRLHLSKLPLDAKRYIKQLENEVVDGSGKAFDALWQKLEKNLDSPTGLSKSTLAGLIESALNSQLTHVDVDSVHNALTGLFSAGKEHAYAPTGFKDKKLNKLKKHTFKQAFLKEAVTIDTMEDKLMLDQLKQTALKNVKSVANKELREKILEALTAPRSENVNPLELANRIIKEESEKLKEEAKADFKKELEKLYNSQQYQLQRIMRTESINGFVLAQLQGYKEQGISTVRWRSLKNDPIVCNLCKTLDGQTFEIDYLLSNGGRYPLTFLSHPNCRCGLEPVIAFVTFEEFEKQYQQSHPDQFVQGEPVFNTDVLDADDVLTGFKAGGTQFEKAPVEHVDELEEVAKAVKDSNLGELAPKKVEFVQDVFEIDPFQAKGRGEEAAKGTVDSWHDPDTNTTYVSSYATQYSSASEVYLRDWAHKIWQAKGPVRKWFESRFSGNTKVLSKVSPQSLQVLSETFKPFALASTYYLEDGDAIGLTTKARSLPDDELRSILSKLGFSKTDVSTVLNGRKLNTLWNLSNGESIESDEVTKFVSETSTESPEQLCIDSIVAYVDSPYILKSKDEQTYQYLRDTVFDGKEFK
jgi:SPP1 gp7 family putative phage head morphogenesis protein